MSRLTRTTTSALVGALALCSAIGVSACGGSSASSASGATGFCHSLQVLSVKYAGLEDNPTPNLVKQAAHSAQQLAGSAPAPIKSAMKTEADAYVSWARTGDDSSLGSDTFAAADDQLDAWTSGNCKQ